MVSNDDAFSTNIDKNISYEGEDYQNNKDDGVNMKKNKDDGVSMKNDKRKRDSHGSEEWKRIQEKRLRAFRNKQAEKKQKINLYDNMKMRVETLENILKENNIPIPNFD